MALETINYHEMPFVSGDIVYAMEDKILSAFKVLEIVWDNEKKWLCKVESMTTRQKYMGVKSTVFQNKRNFFKRSI